MFSDGRDGRTKAGREGRLRRGARGVFRFGRVRLEREFPCHDQPRRNQRRREPSPRTPSDLVRISGPVTADHEIMMC